MARPMRVEEEPALTSTARTLPRPPSAVDLLRTLLTETGELIRSEANVVKLEVQESMRAMLLSSIKSIVAAGVALLGVLSLLAFLIIALGDLIARGDTPATAFWVSALIIGVILTGGGAYFALRFGKEIGREARLPKSQQALRADTRMIREEIAKLKEAAKP